MKWIPRVIEPLPKQCANCRRRDWNQDISLNNDKDERVVRSDLEVSLDGVE